MSELLLTTKLYAPRVRQTLVSRSRLVQQLDQSLSSQFTLVSASAGFGKSTLVSEWAGSGELAVAWLSLDAADSDLQRFLVYFIAALRTVVADCAPGTMSALESTQPPNPESLLTILLNELNAIETPVILVLDDYHLIGAEVIDQALAFLIEHLPPQLHLVMISREDPQLPLARLRARGQMTEIRAADLRFTPEEAGAFLVEAMGLELKDEQIALLEARTEGWAAGLQMAALSMQGRSDNTEFITAFAGRATASKITK